MSTKTIQSAVAQGTWESQHGTMHNILVSFTDGTSGWASGKSPSPWYSSAGTEVDVTVNGEHDGLPKVKLQKPGYASQASTTHNGSQAASQGASQSGGAARFGATVGMAINNSVQIAIAKGVYDMAEIERNAEEIILISERREKGLPLNSSAPPRQASPVGAATSGDDAPPF